MNLAPCIQANNSLGLLSCFIKTIFNTDVYNAEGHSPMTYIVIDRQKICALGFKEKLSGTFTLVSK